MKLSVDIKLSPGELASLFCELTDEDQALAAVDNQCRGLYGFGEPTRRALERRLLIKRTPSWVPYQLTEMGAVALHAAKATGWRPAR